MGEAKRHHGSAPVVYLTPFSEPRGNNQPRTNRMLVTPHGSPGSRRENALQDINVVKGQFTIDVPGLPRSLVEEGWATFYENPYREVRDLVIEGNWPLDAKDRATLSQFMAMSVVKNHDVLKEMQRYLRSEWDRIANEVGVEPKDSEDLYSGRRTKNAMLLRLFSRVDHYANLLAKYKWTLLKSSSKLITGNSPVAFSSRINDTMLEARPSGFTSFDYLSFPISPRLGVFCERINDSGEYMGDFLKYASGEFDDISDNENLSQHFRRSTLSASTEIYTLVEDEGWLLELSDYKQSSAYKLEHYPLIQALKHK